MKMKTLVNFKTKNVNILVGIMTIPFKVINADERIERKVLNWYLRREIERNARTTGT